MNDLKISSLVVIKALFDIKKNSMFLCVINIKLEIVSGIKYLKHDFCKSLWYFLSVYSVI